MFFVMIPPPPRPPLFPYTTLFRSLSDRPAPAVVDEDDVDLPRAKALRGRSTSSSSDRKSTRLNSSHTVISYAVFCLKKKTRALSAMQDTRIPVLRAIVAVALNVPL